MQTPTMRAAEYSSIALVPPAALSVTVLFTEFQGQLV